MHHEGETEHQRDVTLNNHIMAGHEGETNHKSKKSVTKHTQLVIV